MTGKDSNSDGSSKFIDCRTHLLGKVSDHPMSRRQKKSIHDVSGHR